MKCYYGTMDYGATGEGSTTIYYISYAEDEEDFIKLMMQECHIDEFFRVGIKVYDTVTEDTPSLIVDWFRTIKKAYMGHMKFELYFNFS